MNLRSFSLGAASAVTTFLVAAAATIAVTRIPFGDSPGVGILGVGAGFVAGLVVFVVVAVFAGRLSGASWAALVAYATLGVVFLGIAALSYVNVPGADAVFTFPVHIAVSVLLALGAGAFVFGRSGGTSGRKPSV